MKKNFFKFTRPYVFVPMCKMIIFIMDILIFYKKLAGMEMSS